MVKKSPQLRSQISRYTHKAIRMKLPIRSLDGTQTYNNLVEAATALGVKQKVLGEALFFGHRCEGKFWEAVGLAEHEAKVALARKQNKGDYRKRGRSE
jgi:hypothetical protein